MRKKKKNSIKISLERGGWIDIRKNEEKKKTLLKCDVKWSGKAGIKRSNSLATFWLTFGFLMFCLQRMRWRNETLKNLGNLFVEINKSSLFDSSKSVGTSLHNNYIRLSFLNNDRSTLFQRDRSRNVSGIQLRIESITGFHFILFEKRTTSRGRNFPPKQSNLTPFTPSGLYHFVRENWQKLEGLIYPSPARLVIIM